VESEEKLRDEKSVRVSASSPLSSSVTVDEEKLYGVEAIGGRRPRPLE
jgi:hypothetical protein